MNVVTAGARIVTIPRRRSPAGGAIHLRRALIASHTLSVPPA